MYSSYCLVGVLAVCGSKIALYRSAHLHDGTWIPLIAQHLPDSTNLNLVQFSPDGRHLATLNTGDKSGLMKVWTFADFDQPDETQEELINLLGRPFYQNIERLCGFNLSTFCLLGHDEPVAGFAWSPLTQYKNAFVLLTWTLTGMHTVWVADFSKDSLHGHFHIIFSFEAKAAWFNSQYPLVLNYVTDASLEIRRFAVHDVEDPRMKLVSVDLTEPDLSLPKLPSGGYSDVIPSTMYLAYRDPHSRTICIIQKQEQEANRDAFYFESFTWNYASQPDPPIQMVSAYSMLAASVYAGTCNTLDICRLGAECFISDCIHEHFTGKITAIQWISTGHIFVTTSDGCYVALFDEDPLQTVGVMKVHDRPDLQFIGAVSVSGLAVFWDKSTNELHQYQIEFGARQAEKLDLVPLNKKSRFGFLQMLDCGDGLHLLTGSSDLLQWQHYDLSVGCQPESIHESSDDIRFARTSIFGDIALVSTISSNTDALTIVTPTTYEIHADDVFTEVHDTILAVKWVVVDCENYIRHLIVCCTTGIVVYVASFDEDFKETWHSIDLTSFPETLAPPVPRGQATISCNKFLDIWITLDQMIVMWAPVLDSPVWNVITSALEPSAETHATSEFFSSLYGVLLDPDSRTDTKGKNMSSSNVASDIMATDEMNSTPTIGIDESQKYDFLFFENDESGLFSRNSTMTAASTKKTLSPDASLDGLKFDQLLFDSWANLDGPAQKFLLLQKVKGSRGIRLEGLDLLCAYMSEAQDSLLAECTSEPLGWARFDSLGIAFWLKNKDKLAEHVESMCRVEYSKSVPLEEISLFYLLLGKTRALQTLWKTHSRSDPSSTRISQFLHQDFSDESHRLVAAKNAYASLGKQRNRLAIMFFLMAGRVKDAVLVALDTVKDLSLAMVIARLSGHEQDLMDLARERTVFPVCHLAIMSSSLGETTDVIGSALELARAGPWNDSIAILPIMTAIRRPIRHHLTTEEAERSMRVLLKQGAFDAADKLIQLSHLDGISVKCHLSLLRLASTMIEQRWKYIKGQTSSL